MPCEREIKFQLGPHHGKPHPTSREPLMYVDVDLVGRLDEPYLGSFSGFVTPELAAVLLAAPACAQRIADLQSALKRLLEKIDDETSSRDGQFVLWPEAGCIECTVGTVPNDKNTGLCAYHAAYRALKRIA